MNHILYLAAAVSLFGLHLYVMIECPLDLHLGCQILLSTCSVTTADTLVILDVTPLFELIARELKRLKHHIL